jgi:hypothetical protein
VNPGAPALESGDSVKWALRVGCRGGRWRRGCWSRVVDLLPAAVAFREVIGRLPQCGVGRRRLGRRVNRAGGGEGFSVDGERDRREGTEKLPVQLKRMP